MKKVCILYHLMFFFFATLNALSKLSNDWIFKSESINKIEEVNVVFYDLRKTCRKGLIV